MSDFDVIVIGTGAAGLASAALLAKEGKRVLALDRSPYLGGRGMATEDEGYQLNLGAHLLEDPGSGLTRIFDHLGMTLGHGPSNSDMPVWDHDTESWGSIRDRYARGADKDELKAVINALLETPYEELDRLDDLPMRTWLNRHTSSQGVVDLFEFITVMECMTEDWWDHSASDNLFNRKMHYEEQRTAAHSFWPEGGWDKLSRDLRDAVVAPRVRARAAPQADRGRHLARTRAGHRRPHGARLERQRHAGHAERWRGAELGEHQRALALFRVEELRVAGDR